MSFALRLVAVWLLASLPPLALASAPGPATGAIRGTVRNAVTGAFLEGAEIELGSSRRLVLAGRGGAFHLDALPPGVATLAVRYAGLTTQTINFNVRAGAEAFADIALTSDVYAMDAFKVSEAREGNARAVTLQRHAINPKEVVATDAFGNLSDGNVGELLVLLPGVVGEYVGSDVRTVGIRGFSPDLGTTTVDGSTLANFEALSSSPPGGGRNFEFEAISADHIESIEVTKAPTPDMAASSIGGTVNLRTKSALDFSDRRRFRASVGATDQSLRDVVSPNGSFSHSEVLGSDRSLGLSLNYGYSHHYFPKEGTHIGFPTTTAAPNFMNLFRIYDQLRSRVRHGGGIKLDYRPNPSATFFVNALRSDFLEDAGQRPDEGFRRLLLQTVANGSAVAPGYTDSRAEWRLNAGNTATQEVISAPKEQTTLQLSAGGRHRLRDWLLDYDGSHSRGITAYNTAKHGLGQISPILRGIALTLDRTATDQSRPVMIQTGGPDIYNIDNYSAAGTPFTQRNRRGEDRLWTAKLNAERAFDSLVRPLTLKFGGAQQVRERSSYVRDRRWNYLGPDRTANSGDEGVARFAHTSYVADLLNGRYRAPRWVDARAVHHALQQNPGWFDEDLAFAETNRLQWDQEARETILGAYAMATVKAARWLSVMGGARWEETRTEGAANINQVTPAEAARRRAWVGPVNTEESLRRIRAQWATRLETDGAYRDVFPGLHLRAEPRPGLVVRASYSTSIGRPNFSAVLPTTSVNFDAETVTTNNTAIGPQHGRSFNVGFEKYLRPAGLVAMNFFRTDIRDMIYSSTSTVGSGPNNGFDGEYAGFELRTQANGGTAKIQGVEFNWRQQLAGLPGWARGLSLFANFTCLKTSGRYGGSPTDPVTELARFTPRSGNFGLAFARHGIDVQVRGTYKGESLFSYSTNPAARIYLRSRTNITLNFGYRINRHFRVYCDWANIFNAFDPDYQYRKEQIRFNTPSGSRVDFGLKYSL